MNMNTLLSLGNTIQANSNNVDLKFTTLKEAKVDENTCTTEKHFNETIAAMDQFDEQQAIHSKIDLNSICNSTHGICFNVHMDILQRNTSFDSLQTSVRAFSVVGDTLYYLVDVEPCRGCEKGCDKAVYYCMRVVESESWAYVKEINKHLIDNALNAASKGVLA